ncbi:unnamed protein product [Orchesella dallaii]|uniref:DNA endonuclease activator Ctp1 C-terminal domain-containing protein n=2 Tax=Orchesella dallaii TaxID=48710 RepID=A0ABP1Q3L2_9HEXA
MAHEMLRMEWNSLFDKVIQRKASDTELLTPNIQRPKDPLLNLLLNAVGMKLAELEQEVESYKSKSESLGLTTDTKKQVDSMHKIASSNSDIKQPRYQRPEVGSRLVTGSGFGSVSSGKSKRVRVDTRTTQMLQRQRSVSDNAANPFIFAGRGSQQLSPGHNTEDLIKDFDKIPNRSKAPHPFQFKEKAVRTKAGKAALTGRSCQECEQYYSTVLALKSEAERKKIKNSCSRHRSEAALIDNTPKGFWDTTVPSTQELYNEGYIKVASQPFTPIPRVRNSLDDERKKGVNF